MSVYKHCEFIFNEKKISHNLNLEHRELDYTTLYAYTNFQIKTENRILDLNLSTGMHESPQLFKKLGNQYAKFGLMSDNCFLVRSKYIDQSLYILVDDDKPTTISYDIIEINESDINTLQLFKNENMTKLKLSEALEYKMYLPFAENITKLYLFLPEDCKDIQLIFDINGREHTYIPDIRKIDNYYIIEDNSIYEFANSYVSLLFKLSKPHNNEEAIVIGVSDKWVSYTTIDIPEFYIKRWDKFEKYYST